MLLQFNFKNFKSFRDETTLDMTAANITEFSDHVVKTGGERVLPVTAIYGPNASGKSNVCEAFGYMRKMVLLSLVLADFEDVPILEDSSPCIPFCLDTSSADKETLFEVFFTRDDDPKQRIYNYGFTLMAKCVVEEWLNVKAKSAEKSKRIFYRKEGSERELDLSGIEAKYRSNIRVSLGNDVLLVSLASRLRFEEAENVRDWFIRSSVLSFGKKTAEMQSFASWFSSHQDEKENILAYLSTFDNSIIDIEFVDDRDKNRISNLDIVTTHVRLSTENEDFELGVLLHDESDGTLQMLDLYPTLASAFKRGGVVVADELGAHLHPLLLRNVVLSFLNPEVNKGHAQLVFTTHDVWLLFAGLLRRDEVWFTEKDIDGASALYSLADFEDGHGNKIRKDESFGKNYLLGKYGAIPSLSQIGCFS